MADKQLVSLIERVNAATGPDRELDGSIEVQARRLDAYRVGLDDRSRAHWKNNGPTVYDGNTGYEAIKFTASIDTALSLVERCLPGWCWGVGNASDDAPNRFAAQVRRMGIIEPDHEYHFAPTAPLAILAALLSALAAQEVSTC